MLKSKANWKFCDFEKEEVNSRDVSKMDQLLVARGIHDPLDKQQFLHPSLEDLSAPSGLHDIDKTSKRIMKAIESNEKIMIYGDYDADGITSTALLMNVLMDLGSSCDFYIPNRFTDGYGLNEKAIEKFHKQGITLIITVDTGIANVYEAEIAQYLGIDLIITDHHEMQEEIPEAFAIIHPKLSENYPFKSLAGVGVAFQLAHYLLEEIPTYLLEFAAIGTFADLVPLTADNRILVYYGLKALSESSNFGIQALKRIANIDESKVLSERDIGFMIAPRLNAVGRLQDASLAVELLLTMDDSEAEKIALQIESLNSERQQIVQDIVKEAEKRVNPEDGVIMLYDEKWHEGVLGIAASRLVRTFDRPVIMLTYKKDTNELKGSARSIPAFHLFNNGMQMKHLFTQFGGHSQAAGMTFPFDHFVEIKQALNNAIFNQLSEEDFKQEINNIHSLSLQDMTESFVNQVNMLAPFGMGNEEPVFHFTGTPFQIRQIGQHQKHLKMQFKEDKYVIDVIGFNVGNLYYFISQDVSISVVGKLQINEWNGNKTVQLLLEDVMADTWQLFDYRSRQQDKYFIPYFNHYNKHLLIGNNHEHMEKIRSSETMDVVTYDSEISQFNETDILYICDLPTDLQQLKRIIAKTNPKCIHVSYDITNDAFLQNLPTREEFKWVYGFIVKYEPVQLKIDLAKIMQLKGWKKEKILFILKVFLDLQFIYVKDDVIYVHTNITKKPLNESKTYQKRIEQSNIEKILYYSTYEELKQWFTESIENEQVIGEEIAHGL